MRDEGVKDLFSGLRVFSWGLQKSLDQGKRKRVCFWNRDDLINPKWYFRVRETTTIRSKMVLRKVIDTEKTSGV